MPAMAEYARLASGQNTLLKPPANFGEGVRWLFLLLAGYVVLRLVLGTLRLLTRK